MSDSLSRSEIEYIYIRGSPVPSADRTDSASRILDVVVGRVSSMSFV